MLASAVIAVCGTDLLYWLTLAEVKFQLLLGLFGLLSLLEGIQLCVCPCCLFITNNFLALSVFHTVTILELLQGDIIVDPPKIQEIHQKVDILVPRFYHNNLSLTSNWLCCWIDLKDFCLKYSNSISFLISKFKSKIVILPFWYCCL